MASTSLPVLAGIASTVIFAASALPMLVKARRTRDLTSYSRGNIMLSNVGNAVHSIYVFSMPVGPLWLLHTFYLASSALMLIWSVRYAAESGKTSGSRRLHVERQAGLALGDFPEPGHRIEVTGAAQHRPAYRRTPVHPPWGVEGAPDSIRIRGRPEQRQGAMGRGHPDPPNGGMEEALARAASGLSHTACLKVCAGESRMHDDASRRHAGLTEAPIEFPCEVDVRQL
jgi:hypothetical protein